MSQQITSLNKVRYILFGISFAIELLKLGRLITLRYFHVINHLCIWLRIYGRKFGWRLRFDFDSLYDKVLELINRNQTLIWDMNLFDLCFLYARLSFILNFRKLQRWLTWSCYNHVIDLIYYLGKFSILFVCTLCQAFSCFN